MKTIRVLNIGSGGSKVTLPDDIKFEEIQLDIDPEMKPDIVMDLRKLKDMDLKDKDAYDAIWCSHVLEHFYEHEIPGILAGVRHVLSPEGVFIAMVPDLDTMFRHMLVNNTKLNDTIYTSPAGPIRPRDMLYGYQKKIVSSGCDFFAHKTGFDMNSFKQIFADAGFKRIYVAQHDLQIDALVCMSDVPKWAEIMVKDS